MNDEACTLERMIYLVELCSDNDASDAEREELDALLLSDASMRRRYRQLCKMLFAMRSDLHAHRATQQLHQRINADIATAPSNEINPTLRLPLAAFAGTVHNAVQYCSSGWPLAYLITSLLFGVGIAIGYFVPAFVTTTHVSVATVKTPASPWKSPIAGIADDTEAASQAAYVGRIANVGDRQWKQVRTGKPLQTPASQSLIALGDTFIVASGVLEIEYDAGANVILQGPCTYTVETSNGGFLAIGKVTARLDKDGSKRQSTGKAIFFVRTPTALVTDLGTEFGVEYDRNGVTRSHVFRGKVSVATFNRDAQGQIRKLREITLAKDESATIETQRKDAEPTIAKQPNNMFVGTFIRSIIPPPKHKTLDLADVIAGGDGFHKNRSRGIDQSSGMEETWWRIVRRDNDRRYHPVKGFRFIDGVFIPYGGKSVQLDTAGHTFDQFHCTKTAEGHGSIWVDEGNVASVPDGRIFPTDSRPASLFTPDGWIRHAKSGHVVLSMHANAGITFDLDAIRRRYGNYKIERFLAVAANLGLTESATSEKRVSADIWVFVDGQPRFNKTNVNAANGEFKINVEIAPNNRFLTLVSADGGDNSFADWVVFGDPVLEMTAMEGREADSPAAKSKNAF